VGTDTMTQAVQYCSGTPRSGRPASGASRVLVAELTDVIVAALDMCQLGAAISVYCAWPAINQQGCKTGSQALSLSDRVIRNGNR
jgi:hypothetical protein